MPWCVASSRHLNTSRILQILVVYLVQHAMLVGLTLPFRYIASSAAAWSPVDTFALVLALAALATAAHADNSLHGYVARNLRKNEVLCTGAWALCRHPNHVAEALFWWAIWLFAVPCGGAWTLVGTAFNSACMCQVRVLTTPLHLNGVYTAEWHVCLPSVSAATTRRCSFAD